MSKVLFSIQYEIVPEKRDEYLKVVKELKIFLKQKVWNLTLSTKLKVKQSVFRNFIPSLQWKLMKLLMI